MALQSGFRLGVYEMVAPLGAGGMAEVYRARDTELGRDVAVKLLPEAVSQDEERLLRLRREAQLLASVNHPNVATLYRLQEAEGQLFLVMELVEGETLAERIARGPLAIGEVLTLFQSIAEGLEAAHEKGIVHRDLKPANIKITPRGTAKILDFGLAKTDGLQAGARDLSQSPTLTRDATETGVLMGTAPYMSPEQARGRPVDKRTDVWAFGCCLYEALTGKGPFQGETVSDTLAKILEREPDWDPLPPDLPLLARSLLLRCLRKDPDQRCRDIGDARLELEEAMSAASASEAAAPLGTGERKLPLAIAFALVLLAGIGGWWIRGADPPEVPVVARFSIDLPPIESTDLVRNGDYQDIGIALSPDGRRIVVVKPSRGARDQLYLRTLDGDDFEPMPGTAEARAPFFSPDGEWVAFFGARTLKKVSVHGGPVIDLCGDLLFGRALGGGWSEDGSIVFSKGQTAPGLRRVSSDGGTPERLTELMEGEVRHAWPDVLPGGTALLMTVLFETSERADDGRIDVLELASGERRKLIDGGTHPRYASSGHIVFARNHQLFAVPFDLDRLQVTGAPAPARVGLQMNRIWGDAAFALSRDGVLAQIPGDPVDRTLVKVDARGNATALEVEPGPFLDLRLSPDGGHLALSRGYIHHDVWLYDVERRSTTRFLTGSDHHNFAWSPDGRYLAFDRTRPPRPRDLMWRRADGLGPTEQLLESEFSIYPGSWSDDGKHIAYAAGVPRLSLWVLPLDGDRTPRRILEANASDNLLNVWEPMFSPDGRWIAYRDAGRRTIHVIDFPDAEERWTVAEGERPIWHPEGTGLFHQRDGRMMFVPIQTEPTFVVGEPRTLFEDPRLSLDYDVAPDGETFYMIREAEFLAPTELNLVLGWFEELARLAPRDE